MLVLVTNSISAQKLKSFIRCYQQTETYSFQRALLPATTPEDFTVSIGFVSFIPPCLPTHAFICYHRAISTRGNTLK